MSRYPPYQEYWEKTKNYKIVRETDIMDLEIKVGELVNEGFTPVGSVWFEEGHEGKIYFQSVYKMPEPKDQN